MDAGVAHDMDGVAERRFVTEADWIPGFWNYLLDLDRDDLVAELIQNDLDQDATRTVISFEEDRLVSEGNGKPVETEGWLRLRMIQGAGHSVPAKRGKIGVKNHGLKTAFTVGDELQVMSGGQSIIQTLYRDGRNKPPYPGASPEPRADQRAPPNGCRIIIWYRRLDIEPQQGEATVLGAINQQDIDTLFLSACASTRSPGELAPDGSYVQWEEVRRRIVEAHHVDPKSGGGARHAGNLILLCKLHHDNYGRRLSRAAVTAALRSNSMEMYVEFGVDSRVKGRRVELTISDTDEVVTLFFTDYHVAYWLSQA